MHIACVSCFLGPMCLFGKSTIFGNSSSIFGLLRILDDSFFERHIDVENKARCSPAPIQCLIAFWNELDFRFWTRYLVLCMRIIFNMECRTNILCFRRNNFMQCFCQKQGNYYRFNTTFLLILLMSINQVQNGAVDFTFLTCWFGFRHRKIILRFEFESR